MTFAKSTGNCGERCTACCKILCGERGCLKKWDGHKVWNLKGIV